MYENSSGKGEQVGNQGKSLYKFVLERVEIV